MQGLRASGRGRAAVPAWTLATVLSMLVATTGIQEIAARVASPLHLDGRRAEAAVAGEVGALELATRPAPRAEPAPVPDVLLRQPSAVEPPPVRFTTPTPPTAPDAAAVLQTGWEIATAETSETRWVRGGPGEGGQPEHHLEFRVGNGPYERGYGNLADTTLTTPWLAVPDGDGVLHLGIRARMFIEPVLDGVEISWTADGETWRLVEDLYGGRRADGIRRFLWPLDVGTADAVRVRLRFHSDSGGSAADRDTPDYVFADGEHLDVHRVWVTRLAADGSDAPQLGIPRRSLVADPSPGPVVVAAMSGPSINPYHPEFRDRSQRAYAHPSSYLDGFPVTAEAVWLTLDAPSFTDAMLADYEVWQQLEEDKLYWFPGTRIVGAFVPKGKNNAWGCTPRDRNPLCIAPPCPPPVAWVGNRPCQGDEAAAQVLGTGSSDETRKVTGWSTGSRHSVAAFGASVGTCPDCLVVHVDGIAELGIRWPVSQPWIDVNVQHQTWYGTEDTAIDLAANCPPERVDSPFGVGECQANVDAEILAAAERQVAVVTSNDFDPGPVQANALSGAPGVVTVGGHDRGRVALPRTGSHVVAEFCAVTSAPEYSLDLAELGSTFAMATARAGGLYAATLLEARRLLGDTGVGARDGAVAVGPPGLVPSGPLADGRLTTAELRRVVEATATPRPHTDGRPAGCPPGQSPHPEDDWPADGVNAWSLGTGQPWEDVPDDVPAHLAVGYGAVDTPEARALASAVLRGEADLPDRTEVDAFFEQEYRLRVAMMHARWAAMGRPGGPGGIAVGRPLP